MEKFKDLSLSPSTDQSVSSISKGTDTATNSKHAALLDELQVKTDDFMKAICDTKSVTTKAGKIQVKPLNPAGYQKVDAFIGSIDSVIKWYETENQQLRDVNKLLLNGIPEIVNEKKEMQKNINRLVESSTTMTKEYEEKVKIMEEKLEEMKAVEAEMQAKCILMEQKEQEIKKQVENVEVKTDTADFMLGTMKSCLGLKDDNIQFWKQKFEEASRLSHSNDVKLKQKIAQLELKTTEVMKKKVNSEVPLTEAINKNNDPEETASRCGFGFGRGRGGYGQPSNTASVPSRIGFDPSRGRGGFGRNRGGYSQVVAGGFGRNNVPKETSFRGCYGLGRGRGGFGPSNSGAGSSRGTVGYVTASCKSGARQAGAGVFSQNNDDAFAGFGSDHGCGKYDENGRIYFVNTKHERHDDDDVFSVEKLPRRYARAFAAMRKNSSAFKPYERH